MERLLTGKMILFICKTDIKEISSRNVWLISATYRTKFVKMAQCNKEQNLIKPEIDHTVSKLLRITAKVPSLKILRLRSASTVIILVLTSSFLVCFIGKNKGSSQLSVSRERGSHAHCENVEIFRVCVETNQRQ